MSSPNVPPREAAYARDTGATMPTFIEEKRFIGLMRIVDRTSGRKVKALLSELLFLKLVWTSFWRSLNINRTHPVAYEANHSLPTRLSDPDLMNL